MAEPLTLAGFFDRDVGLPPVWAAVAAAAVHAFVLLNLFGVLPAVFIWLERKVSGRIQDRLGPTRVGGRFGWLQGLADGLKLVQKEDLVPEDADPLLFRAAPYVACAAVLGAFTVLPFNARWVGVAGDAGLFVLLGVLSLEVIGIVLGGYASGSKWSLYGGMREAAQMVSYEIPLALCALVPVLAAGSLSLTAIGTAQAGWLVPNWLVFHDPFTALAFVVYLVVATAECKRAPFDLAEAESELVGGFHTEYSSMRWSFFMLAEYGSMYVVSMVAVLLFLGGWYTGIAPLDGWLSTLHVDEPAKFVDGFSATGYLTNAVFAGVILLKSGLLVVGQIWLRWTLPRLRIDQVMATCLKYLVPIACTLLLGATVWPLALLAATGRATVFAPAAVAPAVAPAVVPLAGADL